MVSERGFRRGIRLCFGRETYILKLYRGFEMDFSEYRTDRRRYVR